MEVKNDISGLFFVVYDLSDLEILNVKLHFNYFLD